MHRFTTFWIPGLVLIVCLLSGWIPALSAPAESVPGSAPGSATESVYRTPAPVLVDLVDAPPTPATLLGPKRERMLVMELPSLPGIDELAERELRLGGLRIRPRTHGPSRDRFVVGLRLTALADGSERTVRGLPEPARLGSFEWSPDGSHVAFTHTAQEGIELWVLDAETGEARRLTGPVLNLAGPVEPAWLASGDALVVPRVPAGLGPEPPAPEIPTGPVIRESTGETAAARTYQDLLENSHDEALFEHYLTAQPVRVGLDGGITPLGEPALLWDLAPSPDGRYLLVETLHRPFSYLVPAYRFPRRVDVVSATDGHLVRTLADLPLQESVPIPFGSVPTGPRGHQWRADADATVAWAEALDGGDAGAEAELRDRVFLLAAPFAGEPTPWITLELRLGDIEWGTDDLALVSEWWWKTRRTRTHRVRPGDPDVAPELLFDRSFEDRYNDPGSPLQEVSDRGRRVLQTGPDGGSLYLVGEGASPEGDRPFLDVFDLESKESRRLFRSEAPYYERPVAVLDDRGPRVLTRRESVDQPPNYFVRRLAAGEERGDGEGQPRQVTRFPHPTPQLAGIHKELIRYPRADGVQLTGTLYLPAGYHPQEDSPLPVVMWAYPREFKSADAAGQVDDSPYRFDRIGWWSSLLWLTRGYAVLDGPSMPIIGEGDEEPNDTYVEQLVASAEAAVEEVVRRGVGDRDRMAIGGHSYGAFMTANLLAHSDLFAAGIARSGAYNRSLTPFGFQAEERTVWEAPEVYFRMSPFFHADEVDEPILLIHGEADNNSGTFPMQSERFYAALKGHGATARLVMLPYESHGYRARESILHMLWETDRWLETYVKHRQPGSPEVPETGPRGP